jgi:hypothetical protein
MMQLALLSPAAGDSLYPEQRNVRYFQPIGGGQPIRTVALPLLPDKQGHDPAPLLDGDLKALLCACLASHHSNQPGLAALCDIVSKAVRERDGAWYARDEIGHPSPEMETDDAIQELMQECIRDAPAI